MICVCCWKAAAALAGAALAAAAPAAAALAAAVWLRLDVNRRYGTAVGAARYLPEPVVQSDLGPLYHADWTVAAAAAAAALWGLKWVSELPLPLRLPLLLLLM